MHYALNVGLNPLVVADPDDPSEAFPTVTPEEVQAGLDAAARDLADIGLTLENCLLDRREGAEQQFLDVLRQKQYDIIVFGGGVRLEPSMTPLFERLVNVARTHAPQAIWCFNTGPNTTAEAVRRWWPRS